MAKWPLNTGWPTNTGCKKYSSKNSISSADQIRRLTSNRNIHFWHFNRLQNSRFFFLKISKEIDKAWRKSRTREARKPHTPVASLPSLALVFSLVPDLLFDSSRVLEHAKIRTVLQSSVLMICKNKQANQLLCLVCYIIWNCMNK